MLNDVLCYVLSVRSREKKPSSLAVVHRTVKAQVVIYPLCKSKPAHPIDGEEGEPKQIRAGGEYE